MEVDDDVDDAAVILAGGSMIMISAIQPVFGRFNRVQI